MIAVCSLFLIVFIYKSRVFMKGINNHISPTDHAFDQPLTQQNPFTTSIYNEKTNIR